MDTDTAIKIAKSKHSTPDQLGSLLGISDEVDFLLAKHPNTTAEMLDDICWRQSFDEKIAPVALIHPNINAQQLLDVGIDYPLAAYKNPKFAELAAKDKKYLDQFDGEAFENSFEKALPGFVVEWLLSRGKELYQITYVSAPKRSPEELLRFRQSKHPKVVATLLAKDLDTYLKWAADIGFETNGLEQPPMSDVRAGIDRMVSQVAQGTSHATTVPNEHSLNLALPTELFSVLNQIEILFFKNGRVAFSPEQTFYEDFVRLLQQFLSSCSRLSGLVTKVFEYDLAEIKRFGSPGKKPRPEMAKAAYYVKSELDRSFHRLMVVLASCCQLGGNTDWTSLCRDLEGLVSVNPLPSKEARAAMDGNVAPLIPQTLLDKQGKFEIASMFSNKALEQVVGNDSTFLAGFKGPSFEKALSAKQIPDFVVNWLVANGSFEQQASYMFSSPRKPEVFAKFRDSKHAKIVGQLLQRDDATYLAWATDLGFEMPMPTDDEPLVVRSEVDVWVEMSEERNTQLWKELVPSKGAANTLQGELVRAIVRLQSENFKNGMMNWGDGSGYYEAFTELIHSTLKAEPSFTKLVKAVIDADVLEIKQAGQDGKSLALGKAVHEQMSGKNSLIPADVEMAMQRIGALIGIWCQRHPELIPYSG